MNEKCKLVDIIIIFSKMPSNCNSYTGDGVCKVELKGEGGEMKEIFKEKKVDPS